MTKSFWHEIPDFERNAKGDLLTSTADGNPSTLTLGTNGDFLIPNSANDNGLEWVSLVGYEGLSVLHNDELVYI
ncbi:hypothetical protein LCGC14_2111310 [marine sediment metagenome]|uniref:Uncharacterized protein n=1 Tax=marine sediment metagenome TaxID=412755 RepID=A0A0F9E747_9ZZZZ